MTSVKRILNAQVGVKVTSFYEKLSLNCFVLYIFGERPKMQ